MTLQGNLLVEVICTLGLNEGLTSAIRQCHSCHAQATHGQAACCELQAASHMTSVNTLQVSVAATSAKAGLLPCTGAGRLVTGST